ncbi:MAG: imidazolonepropionase [Gammaproteobacteria bacterium]|nr:imidazolonepropionase [Gammaproteobacteria bacterium]
MHKNALTDADIILHNANLLTLSDGNYGVIENGFLAMKNGKISDLGAIDETLSAFIDNTTVSTFDLQQRWISPGLIDCHTHIVFGGNRSQEFEQRLNGVSYAEIAQRGGGILSTVKSTRAATENDLYKSALKRVECLMDEGVTTIEAKSGYGLDSESELKLLRVIKQLDSTLAIDFTPTFLGAHALPPEFKNDPEGYITLICEEMLPQVKTENLANTVDAFCETIGFTRDQVKRVFEKAKELGMNVKLHAEQLSDQQGSQLAANFGALSVDHLEYISDEGIEAIAKSGTTAVLLPAAFYYLRESQLPPIEKLRAKNVPIALATDCNPGSSPCTSLLLVMNMACTLFKMTPLESWLGVTRHAAKALGEENNKGQLCKGMVADLAIWDIEHPSDVPYAFGHNPCVGVFKNGQLILDKLNQTN